MEPSREAALKLYEEHEALNKEYREKYKITETDTVTVMAKISGVILENKDKPFMEIEKLLIGLAAVYGCQLVKKRGGEWIFYDDVYSECVIDEIPGCREESPLFTVFRYWQNKKEDLEILLQKFREDGIGRLH